MRGSGRSILGVDNVRVFYEYVERKFPVSRRKAYYLMAIHEQLPLIHMVAPSQSLELLLSSPDKMQPYGSGTAT